MNYFNFFKKPEEKKSIKKVSLKIPAVKPENIDALYKETEIYISNTKIGQFQEYFAPLSKQIEKDFRKLYIDLTPFFDQANNIRTRIKITSIFLRLTTFSLLLCFLTILYYVIFLYEIDADNSTLEILPTLLFPSAIAVINRLIRNVFILQIKTVAMQFGQTFIAQFNNIQDQSHAAIEQLGTDKIYDPGRGERAKKWTAIGLWLDDLSGIYDRYVTISSWRIQTLFIFLSLVFRSLKIIVLTTLIILLFTNISSIPHPIHYALLALNLLLMVFCWDILPKIGGSPNNLFTENFLRGIEEASIERMENSHLFNKMSKEISKMREQTSRPKI